MEEFTMPIMTKGKEKVVFAWAVTDEDRQRALRNHSQSLERLRERGGLSWTEMWWILTGRRWGSTVPANDDAHGERLCARAISERAHP